MPKVLWDVRHPLMLHELPSKVLPHGLLYHRLLLLLLLRVHLRPYTASCHMFIPLWQFDMLTLHAEGPIVRL